MVAQRFPNPLVRFRILQHLPKIKKIVLDFDVLNMLYYVCVLSKQGYGEIGYHNGF